MSQPISFKTVPGRHRTQKWNQAKQYNYDGDEWGGFDPYNEYGGGYDEAGGAPPVATQQPRYPAEPPPGTTVNRQNSFEISVEAERRQFSGPAGYTAGGAAPEERRGSPAVSSGRPSGDYPRSAGGRPSADYERRTRERNFTNPEQVPPPLATRGGPTFPPRKSSFSKSPVRTATPPVPAPDAMPAAPPPQTDKPLPFIRPSDIYKRMAEEKERERQSQESSRPSLDSIQRDATTVDSAAMVADNPALSSSAPVRRPSLEPVIEHGEPDMMEKKRLSAVEEQRISKEILPLPEAHQPAEYKSLHSLQQPDFGEPAAPPAKEPSPQLPPVSRFSGFGNDFLQGSTEESYRTADGDEQIPRAATSPSQGGAGILGSTQPSPMATRAPEGQDPAAEILAERQAAQAELQHQPSTASQGFRSVVHTAFDRKDDNSIPPTPISRDNSQSQSGSSGVSRSDTTSTAGISPIMSKVPLLATAQLRQHDRDAQVPPIAEEPSSAHTPTSSRPVSGSFQIPRKPSPGHSRNVSSETTKNTIVVQPGYRRSLDPPSNDNSPAKTPDVVDNGDRRLSTPMAAVTVADAEEAPDVADEATEPLVSNFEPASPSNEIGQPRALPSNIAAAPFLGSSDYSTREADIANSVNSSHEKMASYSPAAEDMRSSQQLFLRTHSASPPSPMSPGRNPPASPGLLTQGLGLARAGTPGSGRNSPAKGRVREIVDNYDEIHAASRRNSEATVGSSKSSWSQFGRSEENLSDTFLRRRGTGLNQVESGDNKSAEEVGEMDGQGGLTGSRPVLESQSSFRPHLPGEWVSFTGTSGSEEVPPHEHSMHESSQQQTTPRASRLAEESVDLTPTTKKTKLPNCDAIPSSSEAHSGNNALKQLKDVGASLGASVLATAGLTSQTRDFGSTEPPQTIQQPELQPKAQTGDVSSSLRPALTHLASDAPSSVASSVPPTPPAKDTPKPPVSEAGGVVDADDSNAGPIVAPVSNYFSDAIAPLRTGHIREGSRQDEGLHQTERPRFSAQLSTATENSDYESDRLRHEIVRSLDAGRSGVMKGENIMEDEEGPQDAIHAPENSHHPEQGKQPLPAAEIGAQQQIEIDAQHGGKKLLLDQRFSWEKPRNAVGLMAPELRDPKIKPEIFPETPYERPRSRQLHVMNDDSVEPENQDESGTPAELGDRSASVSPITKTQEKLGVGSSETGMHEVEPSPISEQQEMDSADSGSRFMPSYYQSDAARSSVMAPPTVEEDESPARTSSQPGSANKSSTEKRQSGRRVPLGFREILAIKDVQERIRMYNETRQMFADMDTGLQNWLNAMLVQHPEHANLNFGSPAGHRPLTGTGTFGRHKHSPSIIKIAKQQFSHSDGTDRKVSAASYSGGDVELPPKTPFKERGEGIDMDRVQQRGKDLMKSAGAGAKGLFAKGRNRFGTLKGQSGGGDKAPIPPPKAPSPSPASPIAPSSSHANAHTLPPNDNSSSVPSSSLYSTTSLAAPVVPLAARHSRASSVSPALHFSRTGTPSSSASRSLSQAFDRLRERSRSKSTGHSRSKSRPSSLVITNLDVFRQSRNTSPMVMGTHRRVEAWNEPDAVMSPPIGTMGEDRAVEERNGTPARLGILPSPTADDFGNHANAFSGFEGAGASGDGFLEEDSRSHHNSRSGLVPKVVSNVPKDRDSLREEGKECVAYTSAFEPASGLRSAQSAENAGTSSFGEDHDHDLQQESSSQALAVEQFGQPTPFISSVEERCTPHRPPHDRNISAIASLPSQRHAQVLDSPSSPVAARLVSDNDDGYSNTLTASKMRSPTSENIADDDDDLYNTTPIAIRQVAPWQNHDGSDIVNSSQQHVASPAERQAKAELQKPLPPLPFLEGMPVQDIATLAGRDEADRRSEVSAEEQGEHASEKQRPKGFDDADSRRSSVSSLDSPVETEANSTALQQNAPLSLMTAQAVPPVPTGPVTAPTAHKTGEAEAMILAPTQNPIPGVDQDPERERFMSRSYNGRNADSAKALSFRPLSRDANGIPVQESLDYNEVVPVDLTGLAGPPSSALPFQQRPISGDSITKAQTIEYEKLRPSQAGGFVASPVTPSQSGEKASENKRPRRFSGIFRGAQQMPEVSATLPNPAPAPSAISDQYGLEDVHAVEGGDVGFDKTFRLNGQQEKRRSSIWEAFKRTPSTTSKTGLNLDESLDNHSPHAPGPPSIKVQNTTLKHRENDTKTEKKPQRSASAAATPTESRQKLLNGLSKLFGRSSTQGRSSPKPKKLQKASSMRQSVDPRSSSRNGQYTGLNPELMIPHPPADLDARGVPIPTSLNVPHQGWYGPDNPSTDAGLRSSERALIIPPSVPIQYRRLHSEGFQRGMQQVQFPEAFKPIEASYGRQAAPVGPPEEQKPSLVQPTSTQVQRQPTLPTQQPYWGSPPPKERQISIGSPNYQLSPQLSGQSQYQHESRERGDSLPTISPVQSTTSQQGFPLQQSDIIASLDRDTARSPAREYAHQQTPWSISLPTGLKNSRNSSQSLSARAQRSGPPSQDQTYIVPVDYVPITNIPHEHSRRSPHGLSVSPQSSESQGGYNYQALTSPSSGTAQTWQIYDPQAEGVARANDYSYPSPPYTQQPPVRYNSSSSGVLAQQPPRSAYRPLPLHLQHFPASQQQGTPSHLQRYHAKTQHLQQLGPEGQPLLYQPTPSSYSGRHDDAVTSEQEFLVMRGASYPGQEWAPSVYD